jgi:diguanylate cyclase (GGDEF)-like protein
LLKAAALRLKGVIRPQDKIARLGGDEFTIVVESAQTREDVLAVAERVIQTLRRCWRWPMASANTFCRLQ